MSSLTAKRVCVCSGAHSLVPREHLRATREGRGGGRKRGTRAPPHGRLPLLRASHLTTAAQEYMESVWSVLRLHQRVLHYCSERTYGRVVDMVFGAYNAQSMDDLCLKLGHRFVSWAVRARLQRKEVDSLAELARNEAEARAQRAAARHGHRDPQRPQTVAEGVRSAVAARLHCARCTLLRSPAALKLPLTFGLRCACAASCCVRS